MRTGRSERGGGRLDPCAATCSTTSTRPSATASARFLDEGDRAAPRRSGSATGIVPREVFAAAGAQRVPRHGRPRGVRRRRRRRLPVQRRARRGARARRRRRVRPRPRRCTTTSACRTSCVLHDRRAEGALAARHRLGRAHHRDRDDRAGHRLRPGVDDAPPRSATATTTSSTARRPSSPTASTPTSSSPRSRPTRRSATAGISLLVVERGHGGLRARAQPRQDRPARPGHGRAVLQRRPGARRQPARRGGPRASRHLVHEPPAGAPVDRRRRRRRRARRPSTGRSTTSRSARPSASRSAPSRTPASARRDGDRGRRRAGLRRPLRRSRSTPASSTAEDAAKAKWWCTELQGRVVDRCVQLHGGYGYMLEYPIARAYADARVTADLRRHDRDHEGDRRPLAGPLTGS